MSARLIYRSVNCGKRCVQVVSWHWAAHLSTMQTLRSQVAPPIGIKSHFKASLDQPAIDSIDDQSHGALNYDEAVSALNTLQTNAATIRQSIALNKKQLPLDDMYKYLRRSGLCLTELEKKSFIHVSGTKGKGSTCALTEAILTAYGVRTGFFSSPHLMSVTERFRINGIPISKPKFTSSFWSVYGNLLREQENATDMPAYFKFLTILAFHIFIKEKVDVIILEVGIGGEFDCTNIIRNTKTVGISSLGLEHTQLLGDTVEEIAWQKAGIIKPNSNVYTSVTQPECLKVIEKRAAEKQASLHRVPPYSAYFHDDHVREVLMGLNDVVQLNASLAIQLSYDWLRLNREDFQGPRIEDAPQVTTEVLNGLHSYNWPGRCQVMHIDNFDIHLDGAHTVESMRVCANWFKKVTSEKSYPKVLIFNTTGDRDSRKLLEILCFQINFAHVYFVPNISSMISTHQDNMTVYSVSEQTKRAKVHADIWRSLCNEEPECVDNSHVYPTVLEAFHSISSTYGNSRNVDILVTGSLHLIGATMLALDESQNLRGIKSI